MALPGNTVYDALVVGAGPAGAHLARLLARTGRRVALLDKSRVPRDKTCGGGLSRKAIALLDCDVAPTAHAWIKGAILTFGHRLTRVREFEQPAGCTVLRSEFDHLLVRQACGAGARLLEATAFLDLRFRGDLVEVTTSRGTLACRRVFAADGVASAVRAKLFGRRAVAYVPALEALVRVPAAAHERFAERVVLDFGGMPHGYGWIFPKRDHLNVGVYSPFGGSALRAHLERFMARCPELGRRRAIEHRGFAIPLRNAAGVFEHGPVALVGDAAGLAEAIFGEGIYFALASAALAAQAETECERGAAPLRYSALLRARLLPELRAAWWLARLLFACPEFSFGHLVRNDRASDLFAGVITGETRYRDCLRQILLAAPKWLFRERTPHELPPLGPGVPG